MPSNNEKILYFIKRVFLNTSFIENNQIFLCGLDMGTEAIYCQPRNRS